MIGWLATAVLAADIVVGVDAPGVNEAIALAAPSDRVVLASGEWPGPVVLDKSITLLSTGGTLVGGEGTTLKVTAPGAVVEDLIIRGSGDELMGPDACIWVGPGATGAVLRGNALTDCLFGIWLHEVTEVRVTRSCPANSD